MINVLAGDKSICVIGVRLVVHNDCIDMAL